MEHKGEGERRIVVHGRKFLEILREMDPEAINLEIGDTSMTMRQKQAEFVLSLQDPEEFPDVKEITGSEEFSVSGALSLRCSIKLILQYRPMRRDISSPACISSALRGLYPW